MEHTLEAMQIVGTLVTVILTPIFVWIFKVNARLTKIETILELRQGN
jgi:hypothetical protein